MRILFTGATGTVGSHAVAAAARAGHDVRLLVRSPEKARAVLRGLGLAQPPTVAGDVTDPAVVASAVAGCDAVVHAAGLLSFDLHRAGEMFETNVEGTRLVIRESIAAGLDPIVFVSSVSALFRPDGAILSADSPVQEPRDPYARSKAQAERIARAHQAEGAPVVCVYPGGVWGPDDPTFGTQITTIFGQLKGGFYLGPDSGMSIIDSRDLAAAITAMLEPGRGPRRYMLAGHFRTHDQMRETFSTLTGRSLLRLPTPNWMLRLAGRAGDLVRDRLGISTGAISYEPMLTATSSLRGDDSEALADLGIRLRPLEETIVDQMRWMHRTGYFSRRQLGRLAE